MLAVSIFVGKIFDHGSVYVCPPHGLRTDKWLKLIKNKVTFYSSLNLFWLLNPAVSVLKGKRTQNRCRNRSESKSEIIQTFRLAGIAGKIQRSFRRLPFKDYLQNISSLTRFIKDKNHAKSAQKKWIPKRRNEENLRGRV